MSYNAAMPPTSLDDGPSPRIQLRVPTAVHASVIARAKNFGMDVSEYMRDLLRRDGHDITGKAE